MYSRSCLLCHCLESQSALSRLAPLPLAALSPVCLSARLRGAPSPPRGARAAPRTRETIMYCKGWRNKRTS